MSEKPRHPREEGAQAATAFCRRFDAVLDHIGMTAAEFARRSGLDSSTLDRIRHHHNAPLFSTAMIVIRAMSQIDRMAAIELGRDLLGLITPPEDVSADFNHDGKEDKDDLIPGAAAIIHEADSVLMLALESLANDGQIDNAESLKLQECTAKLRDHTNAFRSLVEQLNSQWSVKNSRR